ncbi:MAG: 50S ribosomal protein L31 [Candidatus Pacebacteria bacterium]|nr:50S ribosomal protein L31 [Candidatus Paceibacterota bacterium]
MKKDIHPNWHHDCVVTCSCGNSFTTGSMNKTISVDICSACHPFFTGEMKFVDRQGRVDKFIKKRATAEAIAKEKKAAKKVTQKSNEPVKSYKQILQEQQASLKQEKKAASTKEVKAETSTKQASEAVADKTVAKNS